MTVITITDDAIDVAGHAGYAERGSDIVCAGISAITFAVVGWCKAHSGDAACDITCGDDKIHIRYVPRRNASEWQAVREAAIIGYTSMANAYPAFVTLVYDSRERPRK